MFMKTPRPPARQPLPPNAKKVFDGVIFEVHQWEQELYDGTTATFERAKRDDTVTVIPVLPDGQILLIEQEQPTLEPYVSAPGGRVDPGEDALDAAKRELLEETGYEAAEWALIDAHQPAAKIDWAVFTFVAKGLRKVAELDLDPGEKIKLMPVSFEKFQQYELAEGVVGPHMMRKMLEAQIDPAKGEELKRLFSIL